MLSRTEILKMTLANHVLLHFTPVFATQATLGPRDSQG